MTDRSGEQPQGISADAELQKSLKAGGLFSLINQGGAERGGAVMVVYEAIVLDSSQLAEAAKEAETTPESIRWRDLKEHPLVHEGEDRMSALEGAVEKHFSS